MKLCSPVFYIIYRVEGQQYLYDGVKLEVPVAARGLLSVSPSGALILACRTCSLINHFLGRNRPLGPFGFVSYPSVPGLLGVCLIYITSTISWWLWVTAVSSVLGSMAFFSLSLGRRHFRFYARLPVPAQTGQPTTLISPTDEHQQPGTRYEKKLPE